MRIQLLVVLISIFAFSISAWSQKIQFPELHTTSPYTYPLYYYPYIPTPQQPDVNVNVNVNVYNQEPEPSAYELEMRALDADFDYWKALIDYKYDFYETYPLIHLSQIGLRMI